MPHLPVCSTDVLRPVVHQAAPTLDEITTRVGRRGGVLYCMGERGLDHLAGCARPFHRQSRKLDLNPCGTAGMRLPDVFRRFEDAKRAFAGG